MGQMGSAAGTPPTLRRASERVFRAELGSNLPSAAELTCSSCVQLELHQLCEFAWAASEFTGLATGGHPDRFKRAGKKVRYGKCPRRASILGEMLLQNSLIPGNLFEHPSRSTAELGV